MAQHTAELMDQDGLPGAGVRAMMESLLIGFHQGDCIMLQRRQHDVPPPSLVTSDEREALASLGELLGDLPELPADALRRVLALLPHLPQGARVAASQMIAGKVSHDFALRFLLHVSDSLAITPEQAATFAMNKPSDQAAVTRLLQQWVKLLATTRVASIESLRRVLVSAIGLQMMMEAAPGEETRSWIFDAGTQYRVALRDAGAFPAPSHIVQWTAPEPVNAGYSVTIRFSKKPSALSEAVPHAASPEHSTSSVSYRSEIPLAPLMQEE